MSQSDKLDGAQIAEWRKRIKDKIFRDFCGEPNEAHGTKLQAQFDALCDMALTATRPEVQALSASPASAPSQPAEGPTPETFALGQKHAFLPDPIVAYCDMRELARSLERRMNEARRELAVANNAYAAVEQVNLQLQAELAAARSTSARSRFDLTPQQVKQLQDFCFGGETDADAAMPVTVGWRDQHEDGPGWYVWGTEYPEEGSLPLVTHKPAPVEKGFISFTPY